MEICSHDNIPQILVAHANPVGYRITAGDI